MKKFMMVITVLGSLPFLDAATKIELTTYLGIPLVILTGSAGVAFISRRFEAIVSGVILSAMWPALLEVMKSAPAN